MNPNSPAENAGAPGISVVIPVKDEADNIIPLAGELTSAMEGQPLGWECIWVDDGSTDTTLAVLRGIAKSDPRHRYISFETNAGQSAALWAGFQEAGGEIIATIDGDGQNDPADIPKFIGILHSGLADMVNGYRARRQDTFFRKFSSFIANRFRTFMTGKTVRDVGCSTRAFRRECVSVLPLFSGMHRFLPTLVAMRGFRLAEYPVNHRPRTRGRSKYSIGNRLPVGLLDTLGVCWLKTRAIGYKIGTKSEWE